ncbi:hypothetical protein C474_02526 [Halogeometricum pallidum JCM 14848]|uniref:Uncharacterized protein n=1 Tax=Halogeometricum pallidum JCM 14848 TaxID=1227487 RepID=M0DK80_HALPD|nr:hypothetical protein [Halogeometricum pallidum]ELZ34544.1 hypothetical protein C474_02526 [Halogeometricum pallidum JCM 14848]
MTDKPITRSVESVSRRTFLAGVGATTGLAAGVGTAVGQSTETETGTGTSTGTGTDSATDGRRGLIPAYEEFSGEQESYRSQYLLISDPTDEEPPEGAVSNCGAAEWSADRTATYEVSILEKLDQTTEVIKGTNFYTPGSGDSFEVGSTWQIFDATRCQEHIALTLRRVDPEEEGLQIDNSAQTNVEGSLSEDEAVGEPSEGSLSETQVGSETGSQTGTSAESPGFGVAAGVAGLLGGAAAHLRRD